MAPTAEVVSSTYDFTGKVALVTGATGGLGREAARVLVLRNCKVLLGARTLEKGEEVKKQILAGLGKSKADFIEVVQLDLDSLKGVRTFSEAFKTRQDKTLNILVNNAAAIMVEKRELTPDGFEKQFAINHLAPFLLTLLLLPYLRDTALKSGTPSRIVNVSSRAHYWAQTDGVDDYNNDKTPYDPAEKYSVTKLQNLYTSRELHERLVKANLQNLIFSNSLHPGVIVTWDEGTFVDKFMKSQSFTYVTIPEGAATHVFLAGDESIKEGGLYYDECAPASVSELGGNVANQKRLWELSESLVGFTFQQAIQAPAL